MLSIFISWIFAKFPLLGGRLPSPKAMAVGSLTTVSFALFGNLPMVAGTDILKATTISGTMMSASWAIGGGKYGILLGTNLYGLLLCTAGFLLPLALPRYRLSSG